MSYFQLNALITRSLLDGQFCKDILNGKRQQRMREFDLSPTERQAVLSIKADGIDQFIHQINQWMYPADAKLSR